MSVIDDYRELEARCFSTAQQLLQAGGRISRSMNQLVIDPIHFLVAVMEPGSGNPYAGVLKQAGYDYGSLRVEAQRAFNKVSSPPAVEHYTPASADMFRIALGYARDLGSSARLSNFQVAQAARNAGGIALIGYENGRGIRR